MGGWGGWGWGDGRWVGAWVGAGVGDDGMRTEEKWLENYEDSGSKVWFAGQWGEGRVGSGVDGRVG